MNERRAGFWKKKLTNFQLDKLRKNTEDSNK